MTVTNQNASKKMWILFSVLGVVVLTFIVVDFEFDYNYNGTTWRRTPITYDKAVSELSGLLSRVSWEEQFVERVEPVISRSSTLADTLPSIDSFPLVVNPRLTRNSVSVEIFVSTEKSGTGTDGWMREVAEDFNRSHVTITNGRTAKVKIRKIASGTGYQFIHSRKYLPDAYSPSNHYWLRMAAAQGIQMTPVREKTVGNLAGVVMKTATARQLAKRSGEISIAGVVDAVVQGQVVAGYTNPFASSTGLNFLITVLATFSPDEASMLEPEVISAFESFQRNVPFVAMTTLQMRDSVINDGSLDIFVMEYQTFVNTTALKSGYEFIPFGLSHDNPLYAVGRLTKAKQQVLEAFAAFASRAKFQKLAKEYGFNPTIRYQPEFEIPKGATLIAAQKVWKEKKDAGRPITAVFLADVSGSMSGSRLNQLKKALKKGASFISPQNAIGLVTFNNQVKVRLPIKPFKLLHKSAFLSAVKQMDGTGGTAMYNGVVVALDLLVRERNRNPASKPILFVLTDGKTNEGLGYGESERVIQGLHIPVYTIGFEANITELNKLSTLVEAASLKAAEEDISYKIGALLNTQM